MSLIQLLISTAQAQVVMPMPERTFLNFPSEMAFMGAVVLVLAGFVLNLLTFIRGNDTKKLDGLISRQERTEETTGEMLRVLRELKVEIQHIKDADHLTEAEVKNIVYEMQSKSKNRGV